MILVTSHGVVYELTNISFGGPTWGDILNIWGFLKWGDPQNHRFQNQHVCKVRIRTMHPYSDGLYMVYIQPIMKEFGMMNDVLFYYCFTNTTPVVPCKWNQVRLIAATQTSIAGDSEEVASRALDIWESWSLSTGKSWCATSLLDAFRSWKIVARWCLELSWTYGLYKRT